MCWDTSTYHVCTHWQIIVRNEFQVGGWNSKVLVRWGEGMSEQNRVITSPGAKGLREREDVWLRNWTSHTIFGGREW